MELQNVAFERTGSVATVKFNRSETYNVFSLSMGQDLEGIRAFF